MPSKLALVLSFVFACGDDAAPARDAGARDSRPPSEAGSDGGRPVPETVPDFEAASFGDPLAIDNPYWPLRPGITNVYLGSTGAGFEIIVVEVLDETRVVDGVESRVVRDRVFLDGLLVEDTHDWFAQDDAGNVWYMGEAVVDYAYDSSGMLESMSTVGSWEAGRDVAGLGVIARAGHQMPAMPVVGMVYHQEWYPGEAEDAGEVLALDVAITSSDGSSFTTLQTRDFSTADATLDERKHYAAGIGGVRYSEADGSDPEELVGVFDVAQEPPAFDPARFTAPTEIDHPLMPLVAGTTRTYEAMTEDGLERVEVEVLAETRAVAGVTARVVRDRVYLEDVLVEDTRDWFAQDDDGNVWYLGEAVDDYHYDETGALIDVTHEGSWEAGMDVARTGSTAEAGIVMWAAPPVRASYRQEYYEGEAEDMAFVVRADATVRLESGTTYTGCLQTLDWVPLEPTALEYKFYCPGLGQVLGYHVDAPDERVELVTR
jgi:hypothetical protein